MKQQRLTYMAQTQPGFEVIAAEEITRKLEGATVRETRVIADKSGIVLFSYPGDIADLLELRTVEDLFAVVAILRGLPPTRAALQQLTRIATRAPEVDEALRLARQIQPGRGGQGKLLFRVVARQVGQAAYRRLDAQQAVERGIAARDDHKWRRDDEGAIEFWLTLLPEEMLLALRLTNERMRHRKYQVAHMPAALRPAAAAALVWLTRPAPDDVFLDPMCGTGTILIERAYAGRYRLLLGGDISEEAVAAAHMNIGSRYKPIDVRVWDAQALPLDAGSVSAAAVNLPFGRQIGTLAANRALYTAFLREATRVLRPGARLVALTSDLRAIDEALRRVSALRYRQSYPVQVLGRPARVYVIERG